MNDDSPRPLRAVLHGPLEGGCSHWAPRVRPANAAADQPVSQEEALNLSARTPAVISDFCVSTVLRGEQPVGHFGVVEDVP